MSPLHESPSNALEHNLEVLQALLMFNLCHHTSKILIHANSWCLAPGCCQVGAWMA